MKDTIDTRRRDPGLLHRREHHPAESRLQAVSQKDILTLSDRIAVLHEDQIMGVVERNDSNAEELGLMMAGVRTEQLAETKAAA